VAESGGLLNRCRGFKLLPRVRIPASPPVKLFYPLIFPSETLPVSKSLCGQRLIQQVNRAVERPWTQVPVALRHPQLPMAGKLLNCSYSSKS
jgi:hypothetical protein